MTSVALRLILSTKIGLKTGNVWPNTLTARAQSLGVVWDLGHRGRRLLLAIILRRSFEEIMRTLIFALAAVAMQASAQTIDLNQAYETARKIAREQAAAAQKAEPPKEAPPQSRAKRCWFSRIQADRCVYACDNGMPYSRMIAQPQHGDSLSGLRLACPQLLLPF